MKKIVLFLLSISVFNPTNASVFHIDPINGSNTGDGSAANPWKTLEYVINNKYFESYSYTLPYNSSNPQTNIKNNGAPIKAGDTILLYSGLHSSIFIQNYINNDYVTVKAAENNTPLLKQLHIQAGKKWKFEGITVSSEPYSSYLDDKLIYLQSHSFQGPSSDIEIANCEIYSTTTPWTVATDWTTKASDGIFVSCSNVILLNNTIRNVSFGAILRGDYIKMLNNSVTNFSGDGVRLLGSNILVDGNVIKNCYKVDGNHDDGIQSFTTGGIVANHNIIRNNTIINFEDINQPLRGDLQGIGCFNGPYNDWIVENNVIVVNHWHGITFYGANNVKILNNTVVDPLPDQTPGSSWIRFGDDSAYPTTNCEIRNNIVNTISNSPNANIAISNNLLLSTTTDYNLHFIDYRQYDFHLLPSSTAIDNAHSSIFSQTDIEGTPRPQGNQADIGAYEYSSPSSIDEYANQNILAYPNPVSDYLILKSDIEIKDIFIYNASGQLIKHLKSSSNIDCIYLGDLKTGIYILKISDKYNVMIFNKIVKL